MAASDGSSRGVGREELPQIAFVVLGMLAAGRRTGYEITATATRSTRHFSTASDGQVYPWLRKLVERGLAEAGEPTAGGRTRVEHTLTSAGREALDAWLRADDLPRYEVRDEGLLKLFFADGLTVGELRALLRLLRERHVAALRTLDALEARTQSRPVALLTLRHGQEAHAWERDWYERVLAGLDGGNAGVPAAEALGRLLAG